ncbi:SDR family NAD(P)-dependent oxidoreductase [Streptomyces sp. NPDC002928]|uniref:SDR family NAD(P)-dependent oxidoreductase n=1 Tax=Streptomyces sp. NPDC002928 TaxID=3154440 RepID=UPI0033BBC015
MTSRSVPEASGARPGSRAEGLGPVTIRVNNAGITAYEPCTDITEASWDRMMRVDLTGPSLVTRGIAAHAIVIATGLRPRTLAGQRDPAGARLTVVGDGVLGAGIAARRWSTRSSVYPLPPTGSERSP